MRRVIWNGVPVDEKTVKEWVTEVFKERHRYTMSGDTIVVLSRDDEMGPEHDEIYECRVVAKWLKK